MGCLLVLIALLVPRVVLFFMWLLTDWFVLAYETILWPLLGFFLMPYATLAYLMAMLHNGYRLSGGWLIIFVLAVLVDLGHWGGASRRR